MANNSSCWYCPKCKEELDGCHVTYQELCEYCGTAVLSVPESISQETIKEIIKAKADGRLVVLPCKVGNTIYRIISYKCNAVCNKLNACNSFIYNACKAEFYICLGTFQFNDIEWIGKTVFLTREEAEKALQEGSE